MTARGDAGGSPEELASVRHLLELGYVDPLDAATRADIARRAQEMQLDEAEQLLRRGELQAGIGLLEALARAAPDWQAPRHLLARTCFAATRWVDAEEHLDWLRFNGFEHAELSLLRAQLALKRRQLGQTIEHAEYAQRLQSPLPAAELVLGEAFFRLSDWPAADEAYRRAAAFTAYQAAASAGLAAVALRRGDAETAVGQALAAVEGDANQWQAHYRLGLALFRLQRLDEARVALEAAARLNPAIAGPYRWLAAICERQNDGAGAAEFQRTGRGIVARRRENDPSGPLPMMGR